MHVIHVVAYHSTVYTCTCLFHDVFSIALFFVTKCTVHWEIFTLINFCEFCKLRLSRKNLCRQLVGAVILKYFKKEDHALPVVSRSYARLLFQIRVDLSQAKYLLHIAAANSLEIVNVSIFSPHQN